MCRGRQFVGKSYVYIVHFAWAQSKHPPKKFKGLSNYFRYETHKILQWALVSFSFLLKDVERMRWEMKILIPQSKAALLKLQSLR